MLRPQSCAKYLCLFPLGGFYRAKRLFLLSQRLSTVTNGNLFNLYKEISIHTVKVAQWRIAFTSKVLFTHAILFLAIDISETAEAGRGLGGL